MRPACRDRRQRVDPESEGGCGKLRSKLVTHAVPGGREIFSMGILHVLPAPPRIGWMVDSPSLEPDEPRPTCEPRPQERAMYNAGIAPPKPVIETPGRNSRGKGSTAAATSWIAAESRPHILNRPRSSRVAQSSPHYLTLLDEAHLSAEEAQARPHARIPGPDADPQRPRDPQAPAPQGPQAADSVEVGVKVARGEREPDGEAACRAAATSSAPTATGARSANRFLVLYAFPRPADEAEGARLGVSVGRKVGGAVRAQRGQARPARGVLGARRRLPATHDFVLVARGRTFQVWSSVRVRRGFEPGSRNWRARAA